MPYSICYHANNEVKIHKNGKIIYRGCLTPIRESGKSHTINILTKEKLYEVYVFNKKTKKHYYFAIPHPLVTFCGIIMKDQIEATLPESVELDENVSPPLISEKEVSKVEENLTEPNDDFPPPLEDNEDEARFAFRNDPKEQNRAFQFAILEQLESLISQFNNIRFDAYYDLLLSKFELLPEVKSTLRGILAERVVHAIKKGPERARKWYQVYSDLKNIGEEKRVE